VGGLVFVCTHLLVHGDSRFYVIEQLFFEAAVVEYTLHIELIAEATGYYLDVKLASTSRCAATS
jgi:hypothetical protein